MYQNMECLPQEDREGHFYWALGYLKFSSTPWRLSQMGGLKFCTLFCVRVCMGGEGTKDKVCKSLCAYSKLNSTFLLKIFFSG